MSSAVRMGTRSERGAARVEQGQQIDSYSYLDLAGEAVQRACVVLSVAGSSGVAAGVYPSARARGTASQNQRANRSAYENARANHNASENARANHSASENRSQGARARASHWQRARGSERANGNGNASTDTNADVKANANENASESASERASASRIPRVVYVASDDVQAVTDLKDELEESGIGNVVLLHAGLVIDTRAVPAWESAAVDWFMVAQSSEAVLTHGSTFALTAYAASRAIQRDMTLPVTVDTEDTHCRRRLTSPELIPSGAWVVTPPPQTPR